MTFVGIQGSYIWFDKKWLPVPTKSPWHPVPNLLFFPLCPTLRRMIGSSQFAAWNMTVACVFIIAQRHVSRCMDVWRCSLLHSNYYTQSTHVVPNKLQLLFIIIRHVSLLFDPQEKLLLEPYSAQRDVAYIALVPDNDHVLQCALPFFKELTAVYEVGFIQGWKKMQNFFPGVW